MLTYPIFGLTTIVLISLSGLYLVHRWPGSLDMSISLHAAARRQSYWYFAITLSALATMLTIFVTNWLVPTFQLGPGFEISYSFTFALQLVSAWIPDTRGWRRRIHRFAAYLMAIMFLALVTQLALAPTASQAARIVCGVIAVYMGLSFVAVLTLPTLRRHYLIYQSAFVFCLGLSILVVTFWH